MDRSSFAIFFFVKHATFFCFTANFIKKLVLKPNRSFGGVDILVGPKTSKQAWKKTLNWALKHPGSYVVQKRVPIRKKKFPYLTEKNKMTEKNLNVVCGFICSPEGLGILGRASMNEVVNVAQGGGMTSILICK